MLGEGVEEEDWGWGGDGNAEKEMSLWVGADDANDGNLELDSMGTNNTSSAPHSRSRLSIRSSATRRFPNIRSSSSSLKSPSDS